jgi:glycosyltransferase involved in cell wall biosynthesis
MRVLLVTDWTAEDGGIEVYVKRASHVLREAGHRVRLLTSSVAPAARACADYLAFGTDNPAAQALLQISNPFAIACLRRAVREFQPDVVQVNMFEKYLSPAIFPALRRVPVVVLVHYSKPVCPTALKLLPNGTICEAPAGLVCWRSGCVGLAEWLRDRPRYALIRSGLQHAERVLACSPWMAEQLGCNGIAAEAIPLPVPLPGPAFVRAPSREPVFLYVGRLTREKGIDVLLRAFARVSVRRPAAQLRILGGGPRQAGLEALATELGIIGSVRFHGRATFDEVEAALSSTWALVAPSVWPEPLGLAVIEAITRGVPVIASASGGFTESVEEGVSGHLVPHGDERALADRLLAAVDNGPRSVPEETARRLRDRHDPKHHAVLLTRIFQEAAQARSRGGA